jgi:hypothetical protein
MYSCVQGRAITPDLTYFYIFLAQHTPLFNSSDIRDIRGRLFRKFQPDAMRQGCTENVAEIREKPARHSQELTYSAPLSRHQHLDELLSEKEEARLDHLMP